MDVKYREKLQRNASLITDDIDAEQICLYLNGTVLTSMEVDKVYAASTRQERARRLLDFIMSKDTLAYQHFRYALMERYSYIVKKLDDTAVSDAHAQTGEFEKTCILKRRDLLIFNLQSEDIANYMRQEGVLTAHDCSKIRAGASNVDKARVLVDSLAEKGPRAYKTFSLAVKTRQPQLAKIFENTDPC